MNVEFYCEGKMLFGELDLNAAKKNNAFSLKCQHLYLKR